MDLYYQLDRAALQGAFIEGWPGLLTTQAFVSESLPELFRQVWSVGREQAQQVFYGGDRQRIEPSRFVDEFHHAADRRVQFERFDAFVRF